MNILIDASALVALSTNEPDALNLIDVVDSYAERLCCSVGVWEAALAIARKHAITPDLAAAAVTDLLAEFDIRILPIGEQEARLAIRAHQRYGKGTGHPARLNMGDCFAYACAQANGARLLYKGDDFAHTDLA